MKHRVLIIEPSDTHRNSLAGALASRGFDVETVSNGRAGLQQLNQKAPTVLVTALFMGEVDGLEVTHLSRTLSPKTQVLVVDHSPEISRKADYLDAAGQIGANVCLRNPSVDQVVEALENLLVENYQKITE